MLNKFLLYIHTLRYLKLKQFKYRIYYSIRNRFRTLVNFRYKTRIISKTYTSLSLAPSLKAVVSVKYNNKKFSFLNLEKKFKNEINWNDNTHGKLWTYNLNYFEFLHTPSISKKEGLNLINNFIDQIEKSKDGLEPYPISLRVIHWVKFLTYHEIQNDKVDQSLYNQLWILIDKREYHILGNHLLENGFGLLFGAYYFNDKRIYNIAKEILIDELKEQTLADGAHFELSPMYHQLMLYRVLDCYNLVKNNPQFNQELLQLFKEKAEIMLGWLQQISFKNGDIPLLNDSAFDINPTSKELFEYAQRLNIQSRIRPLKESGYRKTSNVSYECVIDIGHIGPDYIPGHAHSDTFNFVLYVKGKPFIVDTGISTYNPTKRRQIERSTQSHNTVQVGNFEQAEIWSSFRVARRSVPSILIDDENEIRAFLKYAATNAVHTRNFLFENKSISIIDEVQANEISKAFLHLHSDIQVQIEGNVIEMSLGKIIVENAEKIEMEKYQYSPQFNLLKDATKIVITFSKQIETIITTI